MKIIYNLKATDSECLGYFKYHYLGLINTKHILIYKKVMRFNFAVINQVCRKYNLKLEEFIPKVIRHEYLHAALVDIKEYEASQLMDNFNDEVFPFFLLKRR